MNFLSKWNPIIGGIFLSFFALLLQFYGIPLEISEGLRNLGNWNSYPSFIIWGILGGAFISSCFSQEFGIKIPPKFEIFKALLAGILMGIGSSFALGDNIGGFYIATANLSASGLTMFAGLIIGTLLGLKYLIWETEKFPSKGGINIHIKKLGPIIGMVALFIIFGKIFSLFLKENERNLILGKVLLFSTIAGVVIQRSKLCMAKALREPFISGETLISLSFILSLFLTTAGVFSFKLLKIQDPYFYILPTFVLGSLIGGILFGLGMVLADSCALSSLWKLGEGQIKLLVVIIFFSLSNWGLRYYLDKINIWEKGYLGEKVYLPEYLTYLGSFIFIVSILFIWFLFIYWNKKTKKFVIKI
uniref:YeeE/YedE family protein n=1 Tax=Thermodesulfobacterium geofontis TaxID=1295609 RepID=A0A7C4NUA4_9BACT